MSTGWGWAQNADFATEFQCPAGSPMNPLHKCVLWEDVKRFQSLAAARRRLHLVHALSHRI